MMKVHFASLGLTHHIPCKLGYLGCFYLQIKSLSLLPLRAIVLWDLGGVRAVLCAQARLELLRFGLAGHGTRRGEGSHAGEILSPSFVPMAAGRSLSSP